MKYNFNCDSQSTTSPGKSSFRGFVSYFVTLFTLINGLSVEFYNKVKFVFDQLLL